MREIDQLETCHGQVLRPGVQVAYVTAPEVTNLSGSHINVISFLIKPGELKVATIVQVIERSGGFAEADGYYELTLDDGAKVMAEDVAVTDGNFRYGSRG